MLTSKDEANPVFAKTIYLAANDTPGAYCEITEEEATQRQAAIREQEKQREATEAREREKAELEARLAALNSESEKA